jgi:dihydroneopterin aldolase
MSASPPKLSGLVPSNLRVRSQRIVLDGLEVQADIGFHDFEIGAPQRLLVSVEVWLKNVEPPTEDHPSEAWNYDFLRTEVAELAAARRYNLQETLAHAIFDRVAAFHGVRALRVRLSKPDVYPDAKSVGVEVASFPALWPDSSETL